MKDNYYRILWKSDKTKEFQKSPFIFPLKRAKKIIKGLKKICKKTIFTTLKVDQFLDIEICKTDPTSLETRLLILRQIERLKKDGKIQT